MSDDPRPKDIAYLFPPGPDGSMPALRLREDGLSLGLLRPALQGESTLGREVVSLTRAGEGPAFEVTTVYGGRAAPGPAMVNSPQFRSGWDAVFGGRRREKDSLN